MASKKKKSKRKPKGSGLPFIAIEFPHLNEENWPEIVLEQMETPSILKEYMSRYINEYQDQLGLRWAKDLLLFMHYLQTERTHKVLGLYEASLSNYPPCGFVVLNLGEIYFRHLGRLLPGREEYKKAVSLMPDFPKIYMDLGLLYTLLGDVDKAIDIYQKAIECADLDDESGTEIKARCMYNQGSLFMNYKGDRSKAKSLIKGALKIFPDYPEARLALRQLSWPFF